MIPFEPMGGALETLIVVFLCLVVANAILAGVIIYIFAIIELVDSIKYNRRIGRVVRQHFERTKDVRYRTSISRGTALTEEVSE
tara:strand:- start:338 stop:589 length:252 start_codon:yes stop_codon:yes gene_type:complete